jgi:predicted lipoprotein
MRRRLIAVFDAIDAIGAPLGRAVVSEPESVEAAIDSLGALQRLLQVDIANALSLTVGFNDNDGD